MYKQGTGKDGGSRAAQLLIEVCLFLKGGALVFRH